MKERLEKLMEYCKKLGADYSDIRVKDIATESIFVEDGRVRSIGRNRDKGCGIRVYVDGSLGFAATNDLDRLEETADKAYEIALASRLLQSERVVLSPKPVVCDHYSTPVEIDPFTVPLADKLSLLMDCERIMSAVTGVSRTNSNLNFRKEDVIYCDSEGSYITQSFCQSGGGIAAISISAGDAQSRSYPNSARGKHCHAGYEYVLSLKMREHAEETAKESVLLANAPDCPSGVYDIVVEPSQMTLQIHESVGHPTELDRVFGSEAAYAGASFVSPDYLDADFKYGSEHVTIVADALCSGGLGTFGYDDEGVRAERTVLIEKGIFKNFLTSRDTASKIGQPSNGAARSDGWRNLPIVRMTNINLMPGEYELDDLIAGIDDGFLLSVNKSWSIDDKRINFQFACEAAYEIKNGKKTGRIFKNPIYAGITTEFWASCDGVANEKYWDLFGTPNCGKGQPGQIMRVGHGSSYTRFRNVKVGVNDVK